MTQTPSTTSDAVRSAVRVRASELTGRGWLNTGGKSLDLNSLRGKIVLLDFWSFCCINCLHVLDELRPLEEEFSDVLVTVGVHSPKFEHEADPEALAAAVERYEIHHPVLDDPELSTWQAYTARAWPTLVVIDPEGYIVAHLSGEGHVAGLRSFLSELSQEHEAKGTLHRGDGPYVAPPAREGDLRFPGSAVQLPDGRFLVVDTGHHRLVVLSNDLSVVEQAVGSGTKGFLDGPAEAAQFNEPQSVAVLPAPIAEAAGYDVLVADTVNHRLRSVVLATGEVATVAGNGVQRLLDAEQARSTDGWQRELGEDALNTSLSSPWSVVWSEKAGRVIVAMAGTHQIFGFDPVTVTVTLEAGSGIEGLLDGSAAESMFAQTSGLVVDGAGDVWTADSETSALRVLHLGEDGTVASVETAVGLGLYDFGYRDGDSADARLQHPLGVAVLPDGSVAIADTYNGAVRRYDPATKTVGTLARDLAEPSEVLVDTSVDGDPVLVVVETNRHQLVRIPLPHEVATVDEGASRSQRQSTTVAPGTYPLTVRFSAPTGQKLDDRWGDPTQLKISSSPEELLLEGAGTAQGLTRDLVLNPEITEGVLHITARAASCDGEKGQPIPDHAACHLYQQDWGIPIIQAAGGEDRLDLDLRGLN
ncbi:MAG: NHL domain-containing thioredoxin family protein [Galactobacter sp.]